LADAGLRIGHGSGRHGSSLALGGHRGGHSGAAAATARGLTTARGLATAARLAAAAVVAGEQAGEQATVSATAILTAVAMTLATSARAFATARRGGFAAGRLRSGASAGRLGFATAARLATATMVPGEQAGQQTAVMPLAATARRLCFTTAARSGCFAARFDDRRFAAGHRRFTTRITTAAAAEHPVQELKAVALTTQTSGDHEGPKNHVPFHRATSPFALESRDTRLTNAASGQFWVGPSGASAKADPLRLRHVEVLGLGRGAAGAEVGGAVGAGRRA
jgi:hypothetical protein